MNAEELGVGKDTVNRDEPSSDVQGRTPEQPAKVTGRDGKSYPAEVDAERVESRT